MTRSLDERLEAAKHSLDASAVVAGLVNVGDQMSRSLATGPSVAYWRELLTARNAARDLLVGLEKRIEQDDFVVVQFGIPPRSASPMRIKYSHARLIGVEAYLSLTWSLADRVSGFVGRVLCSADGGAFSDQGAAKLVSHFVNPNDSLSKSTAGLLFDSIRRAFGWPIAVSYALRNHFIHDGGQQHEVDFFAGNTAIDEFKITAKGWKNIRNRAVTYNVLPDNIRKNANFPTTPEEDLRVLLNACEREMDEALGILLGSACAALSTHLSFLTGTDV